jgi:hypothetical protein
MFYNETSIFVCTTKAREERADNNFYNATLSNNESFEESKEEI